MRLATAKLGDKESKTEVDKVFQSFDINRAGRFTTLELKKIAQDLGEDLTDDEIQHIFTKADLDDDGFVTGEDFNFTTPYDYLGLFKSTFLIDDKMMKMINNVLDFSFTIPELIYCSAEDLFFGCLLMVYEGKSMQK